MAKNGGGVLSKKKEGKFDGIYMKYSSNNHTMNENNKIIEIENPTKRAGNSAPEIVITKM